jgi:hypothetical protein
VTDPGPLGPLTPAGPETWRAAHRPTCPACGNGLDGIGARRPGETVPPADGDWSVCCRCGEVAVFCVGPLGLALRTPSTAELDEFRRDGHAQLVRDLHRFWAERGGD